MATINTIKRKNGLTSLQIQFILNRRRKTLSLGSQYTKKQAERIRSAVEEIADAIETGGKVGKATAVYIAGMTDDLKARFIKAGLIEEQKQPTVKTLWDDYTSKPRGRKESTMLTYENAQKRFLAFFPETTKLDSITVADGEKYRDWLVSEGLAEAQIAKLIAKTRTVFNWGVERDYLEKNIFLKVWRGSYENRSREFFITPEDYLKLLDACPKEHYNEWRVFISLMRIGGLRFGEALRMKWEYLETDKPGWMIVISTKTEHHAGKGQRFVPIFKELHLEIEALKKTVKSRRGDILPYIAGRSYQLLQKEMLRIVARAGLKRWERLFHNLRGSRSNEIFRRFNVVDAASMIGQSIKTASSYYLHQNVPDALKDALTFQVCRNDKTTAETTAEVG